MYTATTEIYTYCHTLSLHDALPIAAATTHHRIAAMPDLTVTVAADTGPRVCAQSGYGPADMDALQLYDAFTINPILFLEDLGFCPKGEGGRFVSGGRIAPGEIGRAHV